MEGYLQNFPNLVHLIDNSDANYVSGLSTILVATIQETKDRISQIEYIFCSQLFPKFQLNTQSQSLQMIYSEAREAAEDAYKKKEKDLLLQIKKLQCQNQQVLENNKSLKLEKAQFVNRENESCNRINELQGELNQKTLEANERKEVQQNLQKHLESKSSLLHSFEKTKQELEEKNKMLLEMQKKLVLDTEGLQQELTKKSKEVDDMMELRNELLQVNQSKSSLVLQKENQLKDYEDKTNALILKLEKMESRINELLSELTDKTKELEKGKELQENLLKKIEFQAAEIMDNEQVLNNKEKENRLLASKVTCLVERADELQKELGQKTSELEEVRKVKDQLLRRSDSSNHEIAKRGKALEELQEEKKRPLDKQKGLGDRVDKLQQHPPEGMKETSEGMEQHMKLLQQIEAKDSELLAERMKTRDVIVSRKILLSRHKSLISQYNFLLQKCNISEETLPPLEGENDVMGHNQTPVPSYVDEQEVLDDKKKAVLVQRTSPASPKTSRILIAPKCPSSSKPCPSASMKRPRSYWRDTRSHQSRVGPDPHDDFLDTPLENVRDNLGKAMKVVHPDLTKSRVINMHLDDSDDQTQDINADAKSNKLHKSPPRAATSGFKYVEPVRKKSERESLKGVECKQCKKFYDAVLPGAGENPDTDKQSSRCEHHNGVSRHRYRYAPPLTPEGFWNIGFESEM
ncbi:protein gamma response 1 isoform X2 [Salvia miltiorrhiza]|uniref:protein gamma response 1 isoform X2 n=1 Tax=Salvia miltiorrhiza TaxID=226208 RepID=UPI0025AB6386|nr:protein gamma response 1 isoform X2 [Salvia miltiorrhiza]XP_057790710.1 protein gamma response 1 isoform X2 [Salvia miltiorrhiza]